MMDEFLWTEIYRPKTIDECILPAGLKKTFQEFVDNKAIPNLLLSGPKGTGKTSVARAMLEQLGCSYIVINGSLNGNIDTLRNDILQFASTVSFFGGRKYIIIDEADYLNANSTQPALRGFIEEFSKNVSFIFTCNHKNRLIEQIHSRCSVIDFKIDKQEAVSLAGAFFVRLKDILTKENVKYDQKVVVALINKHFPDWRRIINECQRYGASGQIDSGILSTIEETSIKELVGLIKDRNFNAVRTWVGENFNNDQAEIFRSFYDNSALYVKKDSIPQLIILIARYQYNAAFVVDQEINLVAFFIECMSELEFV